MSADASPLDHWQQGDLALIPLELPCIVLVDGVPEIRVNDAPFGVAMLTQTCEIIKPQHTRPDVQVAALVKVEQDEAALIQKGDKPNHALVPGIEGLLLAIDLDAAATVSKDVAALWPRTLGCPTDDDKREFARKLARHRQRFAFPDEFNDDVLRPMRRWVESKRKKNGEHGAFIKETFEFRIICNDWANPAELTLLSIMKRDPIGAESVTWRQATYAMLEKGNYKNFPKPVARIVTFEDISAKEYLASDRLDWDGLSDV
jgi:hypothetical protein